VLPFTSQTVRELLGEAGALFGELSVREFDEATRRHLALTYDGAPAVGRWERAIIPAGRQLPTPRPLFTKLEAERGRSRTLAAGAEARELVVSGQFPLATDH
jgi:hypothetical protein